MTRNTKFPDVKTGNRISKPIWIGTEYLETCVSYITRLAIANPVQITPILSLLLAQHDSRSETPSIVMDDDPLS
jgi:hypothetical protein